MQVLKISMLTVNVITDAEIALILVNLNWYQLKLH